MQVKEGNNLYLKQTPKGFEILANDPELEEEMIQARKVMKQYNNALRELAQ